MQTQNSNVQAMAQALETAAPAIIEAYNASGPHSPDVVSPTLLHEALTQFFQILEHIDNSSDDDNIFATLRTLQPQAQWDEGQPQREPADMTELGEYGIGLLQDMAQWALTLELEKERQLVESLSVPVALWTARHGGQVNTLEPVVNSLAAGANQLHEPQALGALARSMGEIVAAAGPEAREGAESGNPASPWRILNLNRGIVAARSQDPAVMEEAFEALLNQLPEDAAAFFEEGLRQTDQPGYPAAAREVLERFAARGRGPH